MAADNLARVLAICSDPGGVNNVIPVVEELKAHPAISVELVTTESGAANIRRSFKGFDLSDHMAPVEGSAVDIVQKLFQSASYGAVIGGTSAEQLIERQAYREARHRRLPSLALLDFWSYYRERFGLDDPDWGESAAPAKVVSLDQLCRRELIEAGFSEEQILDYGSPHFERLFKAEGAAARRHPKGSSSDIGVGFVSSPRRRALERGWPDCGFDEYKSLTCLVDALRRIADECGRSFKVVIRTHPREEKSKFDSYLSSSDNTVSISLDSNKETRAFFNACDILTGMDSVMLFEGALLGLPAVSIQPGLIGEDRLKTNLIGVTTPVYDGSDLAGVLRALIENGGRRHTAQGLDQLRQASLGAAKRVAEHVVSCLRNTTATA